MLRNESLYYQKQRDGLMKMGILLILIQNLMRRKSMLEEVGMWRRNMMRIRSNDEKGSEMRRAGTGL